MSADKSATSNHFVIIPELLRDEVFRIETRRLWLRWPTRADASALHAVASIEAVARQTATWPHPFPEGEALRRIEQVRERNAAGTHLGLSLALKHEPGKLIGLVGLGGAADGRAPEIGYMLGVQHQGYGLMTEAVRALVGMVFRYTAIDRIQGASGLDNIASRRVMEKAGFVSTGRAMHAAPARGAAVPCDALVLTRKDWSRRPCIRPIEPLPALVGEACASRAA